MSFSRAAFVVATLTSLTTTALADEPVTTPPAAPPPTDGGPTEEPKKEEPKEPGQGDFDAGGQFRLPNGPDEDNEFATFNWVAVDLKGRYFLLDSVTVNGFIPLAVKHPKTIMTPGGGTVDPRMIGGAQFQLEAKLPKIDMPMVPSQKDNEVGVALGGAYMREGAMLLSEKDYPLFAGDFKFGFNAGLIVKAKVSSVVDFKLLPQWVFQDGSVENQQAVQIPMALVLKLGDVVKTSVDLGIYTGDDYTFRSSKGGRVAAGAALDVKIGPILAHAGAGVASLGTGDSSAYPTIRDAVYIDLNAKYAP